MVGIFHFLKIKKELISLRKVNEMSFFSYVYEEIKNFFILRKLPHTLLKKSVLKFQMYFCQLPLP